VSGRSPDQLAREVEVWWPTPRGRRALAELEAQAEAGRRARSFVAWIVALDEPGATERRTITMTKIIEAARSALAVPSPAGQEGDKA